MLSSSEESGASPQHYINMANKEKKKGDNSNVLINMTQPSEDTNVTSYTTNTATSGISTMWTFQSLGVSTILRGDDMYYVKQKFGVCSILIAITQLFYLAVMISLCGIAPLDINPAIGPYPDIFSLLGGKNAYSIIVMGEKWRMLTAPLMSTGIIHFVCNCAVLLETCAFFEREWGSAVWVVIYSVSAFTGTLFSIIFDPNEVSVASTSPLMGLFGAKICESLMMTLFDTTYLIDSNEAQMEQLSRVLCTMAFLSLFSFFPQVDGLMGGFAGGFTMGMILFSRYIKDRYARIVWLFCGLIATFSLIYQGLDYMSYVQVNDGLADACEYYAALHQDNYDCTC